MIYFDLNYIVSLARAIIAFIPSFQLLEEYKSEGKLFFDLGFSKNSNMASSYAKTK